MAVRRDLQVRPARHDNFQVKYTNQNVLAYARAGKVMLLVQRNGQLLPASDLVSEPVFFWIKSSAKRAFGGCLGSKRR